MTASRLGKNSSNPSKLALEVMHVACAEEWGNVSWGGHMQTLLIAVTADGWGVIWGRKPGGGWDALGGQGTGL